MELKDILKTIREKINLIIFVSVVGALIFGYVARQYTPRYHAGLSVYVDKPHEVSQAGDYSYDGFYAQQVAEAYTDTVVGLLESPDILVQALKEIEKKNIEPYKGAVRVQKTAPQIVSFKVVLPMRKEAVSLVSSIADVIRSRVNSLNQEQNQKIEVNLIDQDPLVEYHQIPAWLGSTVGFMLGALVMVFGIIFRQYLRE